jgi:NADH:ubiquinone reductase (non-electrogenic)
MASSSRAFTRFAGAQLSARAAQPQLNAQAAARVANLTTSSAASRTTLSSAIISRTQPAQTISRQFRRTYADSAPVTPPPAPKKRKIRYFRWAWRLTYLSLLGSLGYVVYDGFQARHPDDQFIPDPNKKTLVVLGKAFHHV